MRRGVRTEGDTGEAKDKILIRECVFVCFVCLGSPSILVPTLLTVSGKPMRGMLH